ncbi:hypothetical protein [Corynebacterium sp. HS2168-gen11]|uniref:hypothetical protein n=1 Tax=Corynebacterium sp. HS2168-gen11 TaxID=2974027 RepID=UPI00216B162E|nr:hypothetical protein [Corynebacterium sp. HS2168-gen11]MCS4535801.1 hypothetical protein [Corynebacterium sp. HS2168-gen11]
MSVDPWVIIRKFSGGRESAVAQARSIVRQVANESGLDPFCIGIVDLHEVDRDAYGEFFVSASKSTHDREVKLLSLIFESIVRDTDWDVDLCWGGLEDEREELELEHMRRVNGADSAEVFDPYESFFEDIYW